MNNISLDRNDAIDDVLCEYSNMVYRLALSQTKNKSDAEDVFLRYIGQKKAFESEEHKKAWLIRVTINCSRKRFASAWFRHTIPLNENLQFETKEKSEVYYAVLELPIKYRTAIHLFYYENFSISEIGEILSLKESTVKSHLHRAKQMLRLKLKGEFDSE